MLSQGEVGCGAGGGAEEPTKGKQRAQQAAPRLLLLTRQANGLRGDGKPKVTPTALPRSEALVVGTKVRLCPKSKKNKKKK